MTRKFGEKLHLPQELHDMITTQLSNQDLCNYRLINRECRGFGAPELFRVITFHASERSVAKLSKIAASGLASHVRAVVYDDNMWDIVRDVGVPGMTQSKWSTWMAAITRFGDLDIDEQDQTFFDVLWRQNRRYRERKIEHARIVQDFVAHENGQQKLQSLLRPFTKVTKVIFVNGQFISTDRTVVKYCRYYHENVYGYSIFKTKYAYPDHLFDPNFGVRTSPRRLLMPVIGSTDHDAASILYAILSATRSTVREVTADNIIWTAARVGSPVLNLTLPSLTTLKLNLFAPDSLEEHIERAVDDGVLEHFRKGCPEVKKSEVEIKYTYLDFDWNLLKDPVTLCG